MEKYSAIIADDNPIELDLLKTHLDMIGRLEIKSACENGKQLWDALQQQNVDIVLSDIDMPGLTGMEVLKGMKNAPVFIFITSHSEYAAESYTLDVVDFMVKPVAVERLAKAVAKAIDYIEYKALSAASAALTQAPPPPATDEFFFVKTANDYIKIRYDEITHIESMGAYTQIFTRKGSRHITLVNLKQMEEQLLGNVFIRIHKQHIINYQNLVAITPGEVIVEGGVKIPIGSQHRAALLEKVGERLITRNK